MLNTKETLKRLHKKFPMMGLDELFEILDCYIEESITSNWLDNNYNPYWKTWCSTTTGDNENINKIDATTTKISPAIYEVPYNGKIITTADIDTLQFTTSH